MFIDGCCVQAAQQKRLGSFVWFCFTLPFAITLHMHNDSGSRIVVFSSPIPFIFQRGHQFLISQILDDRQKSFHVP
jgi:hypothetical protein